MTEFNMLPPYRGVIHPWDTMSILEQINALGGAALNSLTSTAWPSGSLAILVPFYVPTVFYMNVLYWINGATANGQVEMGVYTEQGHRVYSTGPVAQSGTTAMQRNMVSPPIELGPGVYYLALVASATTVTIRSAANSLSTGTMAQVLGMAQAPSAYPLPQVITGTWRTVGQDLIPGMGVSSEASSFL